MNSLGVTLGGVPFAHLVYHLVLVYSNIEAVRICFSESFESARFARRTEGSPNSPAELRRGYRDSVGPLRQEIEARPRPGRSCSSD